MIVLCVPDQLRLAKTRRGTARTIVQSLVEVVIDRRRPRLFEAERVTERIANSSDSERPGLGSPGGYCIIRLTETQV